MSRELALFRDFWNDVPSPFGNRGDDIWKAMNGRCDFEEEDDHYELELEVPGVKRDEISLELKNDVLTVSWSRSRKKKKGLGKNSRFERSEGSFTRSFSVPGADQDKVEAELKNGLLKVAIDKKADYRPKNIRIR